MSGIPDYETLARFYDADHADFDADIHFYRELARRSGGQVLEAMCGSGRLLVPLARDGSRVTGVDSSAAMLALARQRASEMDLGSRITLVHADIREPLEVGPFGLAIVALNSFMHLTSTADQLAALASIHAALRPGALLALDLFNPSPRLLSSYDGELVLDKTISLADSTRVQKFVSQQIDPATQLTYLTFIYDELSAEGFVRRYTLPLTMRWLHRYELEHLLARAGFALEALYGSYDLDELRADSEIMLAVARRT